MAATPATSSPAQGAELAERILSAHAAAASRPGSRLPTERELVAELGVPRTAVRHALAILEAEGRISREVGRGTFVRAHVERSAGEPARAGADDFGPAEVMAARRLIEPEVLPLVVAWATPRDFAELRRCLAGGATAANAEEFEVWDLALHHAIVAASRNQLVLSMYAAVERARQGELWGSLKRRNDSRERRALYQEEHAQLVEAICTRDVAGATAVMEAHLTRVEANLLGAGGPPATA